MDIVIIHTDVKNVLRYIGALNINVYISFEMCPIMASRLESYNIEC